MLSAAQTAVSGQPRDDDATAQWLNEWTRAVEADAHRRLRESLESGGVTLPPTVRHGALSLDASLILDLLREQSDERRFLFGTPATVIAEALGLPHCVGSSWNMLWHAWIDEPLAELERARMVIRMADGWLIRGVTRREP